MDDPEKALCVGSLYLSGFAVSGGHLNQGTNCTPVGTEFRVAAPEPFYVLLDVRAVGEYLDYILNREVPFLFLVIPYAADVL